MNFCRRHRLAALSLSCAVVTVVWAALAPIHMASRDELLEIPNGASARRMAGDASEILPARVRLTLGVRDVLLLRNSDTVPQVFGPVLLMPGQDFRLPFEQASNFQVASTAHTGGQVTIIVVPLPDPGAERLGWRFDALMHAIRYF
jgi:hypothetical protein